MSKIIEASDNDLSVIMSGSLEAAKMLATAAMQKGSGPLRERYLEAMHSAMVAAEQARQMAGREQFTSVADSVAVTAPTGGKDG